MWDAKDCSVAEWLSVDSCSHCGLGFFFARGRELSAGVFGVLGRMGNCLVSSE